MYDVVRGYHKIHKIKETVIFPAIDVFNKNTHDKVEELFNKLNLNIDRF